MLTKKLIRHGNRLALMFEKPIRDMLDINDNTMLRLHTDGESLILTPVSSEERSASIRAIGHKFSYKFPHAMKILADEKTHKSKTRIEDK